jgi:hypothetical protein
LLFTSGSGKVNANINEEQRIGAATRGGFSMAEASPARANMGFIGAIVAVATIGGFLFGYDSGAVNGTQEGLRQTFNLGDSGLGFTVGSLLIGCFIGAFLAGRLADLLGRRNVMILAAVLFLVAALVQGFAETQTIFVIARLHFGGRSGERSRTDDHDPADHDHYRPHRRLRRQLFPGRIGRRIDSPLLGGHPGLALDVPDAGDPCRDLPHRLVLHS